MGRYQNPITDWTWGTSTDTLYAFSGADGAPDMALDSSWTIKEKYIPLAGGVTLTVRPTATGK